MFGKLLFRYKQIIVYGVALALLMFLLKWLELRFVVFSHSTEIYIGCIALFFTAFGIWLAGKILAPKVKTIVEEKPVYILQATEFIRDELTVKKLGLSKRELEVLQLMATGLSNAEIAAALFVSLSTIKTHTANIFEKLDVKRRMQAIEKAKKLNIIT
jgi:DNA-binding CsgD family transcriptional regulator